MYLKAQCLHLNDLQMELTLKCIFSHLTRGCQYCRLGHTEFICWSSHISQTSSNQTLQRRRYMSHQVWIFTVFTVC